MDQKAGDWFFEQGELREEDEKRENYLGEIFGTKMWKILHKNRKHLVQQWEPDSILSFNLSCTMQFPILRFRFRWNNPQITRNILFVKVNLVTFDMKMWIWTMLKPRMMMKTLDFFLQQVDIWVVEVLVNNQDNNVKLFTNRWN